MYTRELQDRIDHYIKTRTPILYTTYKIYNKKLVEVPAQLLMRAVRMPIDSTARRLTYTDIPTIKVELLEQQNHKCKLCDQELLIERATLDYSLRTGLLRGVLHKECDLFLRKFENNIVANKLTDNQMNKLIVNIGGYIIKDHTNITHPNVYSKRRQKLASSAK